MACGQADICQGIRQWSCVKKEMHRQFGDEILLEEEKHAWEHHGWFLLKFQYIPKPYMIQY